MRPKMNVFVLFLVYSYFTFSSCDEEKDRLADEETIRIVGPENTSEPNGDIDLVRFSTRTKRDIGDSWVVPVHLKNGTIINLNLTLTEGILINNETPIWNAKRKSSARGIEYTLNNKIMSRLGDIHLYQDYANKAAVAVFHKNHSIEGWVAYHRFKELPNFPGDLGILKKQESSPYSQSLGRSTGIQSEWDGLYRYTQTRTPPDVVYPEILIQLDRAEVSKDQEAAVRRMIGYWNAVDMLYSKLKNPQIKINIAGIIIPEDKYTTPWITSSQYRNSKKQTRVDSRKALDALGIYFSTLRHQFPDDSYDFMFSFVSDKLDHDGSVAGTAIVDVSCQYREHRVSVIRTWETYKTSAHELAHLLSNAHDNRSPCKDKGGIMKADNTRSVEQLKWSKCSEKSFTDYFRKSRSKYFDNCPSTMKNCAKPPIRRCIIRAKHVCIYLSGYNYIYYQGIDCVKDLRCRDPLHGSREVLVPILNGTIATWRKGLPFTICRNGQRVPIHKHDSVCELS